MLYKAVFLPFYGSSDGYTCLVSVTISLHFTRFECVCLIVHKALFR